MLRIDDWWLDVDFLLRGENIQIFVENIELFSAILH